MGKGWVSFNLEFPAVFGNPAFGPSFLSFAKFSFFSLVHLAPYALSYPTVLVLLRAFLSSIQFLILYARCLPLTLL